MKHLTDTTYWQHLKFSWGVSGMLVVLVVAGLVHGLVPWFFQNLVSSKVQHLNKVLDDAVG
jgi:hypothetical protein